MGMEKFDPFSPELETVRDIERKAPEAAEHFEDAPDIKTADGKVIKGFVRKGLAGADALRAGGGPYRTDAEKANAAQAEYQAEEKLKEFKDLKIEKMHDSVPAKLTMLIGNKKVVLTFSERKVDNKYNRLRDLMAKRYGEEYYNRAGGGHSISDEKFLEKLKEEAQRLNSIKDVVDDLIYATSGQGQLEMKGDGSDYVDLIFGGSVDEAELDPAKAEALLVKIVRLKNDVAKGEGITYRGRYGSIGKGVDTTPIARIAEKVAKGDEERAKAKQVSADKFADDVLAGLF